MKRYNRKCVICGNSKVVKAKQQHGMDNCNKCHSLLSVDYIEINEKTKKKPIKQ